MTVYEFAQYLFKDAEFNRGGIAPKERKYIDGIGFEYTMKDGCLYSYCDDLRDFYRAMGTLLELHNKYDLE